MKFGTHHAYVIEGDRELVLNELHQNLRSLFNIREEKTLDIMEFHEPSFLVEHARAVKEADIKAPFALPQKSILISFDSITREAQNALLKVLEDPSPTSRFFILTPTSDILLPTILSRVEVLRHESYGKFDSPIDAKKFLALSSAKRLEAVTSLLKDISDEKKTKRSALCFLQAVRQELEQRIMEEKEKDAENLKSVLKALTYADDKSSSLKLLLERVSLC